MGERTFPVDPFNPGQVFASLGFLEAAEVLEGGAEGGFIWDDEGVRFRITVPGSADPVALVLEFLARAETKEVIPAGWQPDFGKGDEAERKRADFTRKLAEGIRVESKTFPAPPPDGDTALPIRLRGAVGDAIREIDLGHWTDGSGRDPFKLYTGNRSALKIAQAMLHGNPTTRGVEQLLEEEREALLAAPFDVLTPIGGSFNFDPRGAWNAQNIGFSLNEHDDMQVVQSPVVEILAAWGLENARPRRDDADSRQVRYAVWGAMLPVALVRPALAGEVPPGIPARRFVFRLAKAGQNHIVQFAEEDLLS